ncbi:MAG: hypothetical protein AMXMBFR58_13750 [Phycisphaerae bacterium]
MPSLMLFDDGKGLLAPLSDLRPSFGIRTGALSLFHRCSELYGQRPRSVFVPDGNAALTSALYPDINVNTVHDDEPVLLINGRCAVPRSEWMDLAPGEAVADAETGDIVAACVPGRQAPRVVSGGASLRATRSKTRELMYRPWHVRSSRDAAMGLDLELLTRDPNPRTLPGVTAWGPHPISIHPSARVSPTVVLEAEAGPIVIDEDAVVRPGTIIIGPAYVGRHATILERTLIKSWTAIGPYCKVAGEISGTIFQGFANKAHDGHLGDSWVGEWVNLGAGTTNSNLLNTYDQVITRATPTGPNERTGEQFLGAIIGDHVKFAICSRIMTGAVLHTGCMFAQTAPISGCVGAFAWATDAGVRQYRLDKFIEVAKVVMARRKITPSEAYLAKLTALHAQGA